MSLFVYALFHHEKIQMGSAVPLLSGVFVCMQADDIVKHFGMCIWYLQGQLTKVSLPSRTRSNNIHPRTRAKRCTSITHPHTRTRTKTHKHKHSRANVLLDAAKYNIYTFTHTHAYTHALHTRTHAHAKFFTRACAHKHAHLLLLYAFF